MIYAPVLITVYTRYQHFIKCVESLKSNLGAINTHLFVAMDAPKTAVQKMDCEMVYEYAASITGFKDLTLIRKQHNVGPTNNIREAMDIVTTSYDRVIFTEDDNVFASTFLDFMNKALELYKDDPQIYAINGYNYPINTVDIVSGDVYKFKGYCAWGVGLWQSKRVRINRSRSNVVKHIRNPINLLLTHQIAPHYNPHLLHYARSGNYAGDAVICLNLIQDKLCCIFPVKSLVRNIGMDGSGVHKGNDIRFGNQYLSNITPNPARLISKQNNYTIHKRLRIYFSIGTRATLRWIYYYLKFMLSY